MKQSRETYPQAIVPEHLTKLTIENIPLDKPFYISPGERDDYQAPAVFVDHDNRLRMSRSTAVEPMDTKWPIGHVGIMRSAQIDPETNTVRDIYIADLRMIETHSLVDYDEAVSAASDQEEYMAYVNELNDSIVFDGFIAAEADGMETEDVARGIFYGNEALHPILNTLDKRTKKLVKRAMQLAAKSEAKQPESQNAAAKKKQPKT